MENKNKSTITAKEAYRLMRELGKPYGAAAKIITDNHNVIMERKFNGEQRYYKDAHSLASTYSNATSPNRKKNLAKYRAKLRARKRRLKLKQSNTILIPAVNAPIKAIEKKKDNYDISIDRIKSILSIESLSNRIKLEAIKELLQ